MLDSKARWKVSQPNETKVQEFSNALQISTIASRFLVQRGFTTIDEAKAFLHTDRSALHDPFLLKDMEKAVQRIKEGIANSEKILVFGDYDADGVTSTSVMFLTLLELGAQVGYYVPNRFTEGYGPNENAFRQAKEEGVSIIVTVDTGISAIHEAEVAKELGIDLIITDHHEPPPQIPDAYAVINPKQDDCQYPNSNLAGVGVAFKVSHALFGEAQEKFLDLVAIGTIADLVPLKGENRYLATAGVKRLANFQRLGLKALLDQCGVEPQDISEEQIGFIIGPRLNAAGRLDSADPAIHLLICEDPMEAEELAVMIDDLNKERQNIVNEIAKEAEEQVEQQGVPPVIIVGQEGWNAGVIGIVASRLVEKYYRPTIVLSFDSSTGLAKGSARSIEGFDMFHSLSQCREWLPHFGGHPMAAGLTMEMANIDKLHGKLMKIAEQTLKPEDWVKSINVDLPVEVEEVTVDAIYDLKQMAPFGVGNPAPKILLDSIEFATVKKIGAKQDHLKVSIKKNEALLDGIGFRFGELYDEISPQAKAAVVGQLSINEWNGNKKPQIVIEDIKINEWQLFDLRSHKSPWEIMKALPSEKVSVVVFREDSEAKISNLPQEWEIIRCYVEGQTDVSDKYVLLLDLPVTMNQLKGLIQGCSPKRIYPAFLHEQDHFFETLPKRDHFKWFYAFLKKRGFFDLGKHGHDLAKHKGWSKNSVHFICKVFFDLGFVKINNGLVTLEESPNKQELTASKTYQEKIEQSKIENELYYSSTKDLKDLLSNLMAEAEKAHV
ncbi:MULTISPECIES: single-stranded-DNA-specific exonuclease RecJ [Bacillaceae]|uniref:Single-stranded-DNA-specific exonuclease RecJ n=1 Tax=Evansella alkalicola TaxID=745819 RepID=A0ABS6JQG9_9BACI|nr:MULTISPECIES: single-stranded-DNA-specific exonuclease RecJ [Bacillaceae]MBU9720685.1 single-stranded-DNA-specific exonuclease RecJ [Bacillus alkalicola]